MALQWLPCQAPGVMGSVLGLVGPVSVYCDWVRWKVWSAASISVWPAARKVVGVDPSLRYTGMLLGREATNKQNKSVSKSIVENVLARSVSASSRHKTAAVFVCKHYSADGDRTLVSRVSGQLGHSS